MADTRHRRRPFQPSARLEHLETRALLTVGGTLDTTFGGGAGYVQPDAGVSLPEPDGTILIAGVTPSTTVITNPSTPTPSDFELQLLNANGTPDTSYGQDGKILVPSDITVGGNGPFGSNPVALRMVAAALQPDGKVIMVTASQGITAAENVYVARFNTDGTLDSTFGTNGIETLPTSTATPGSELLPSDNAIALQPNGQIVLAGTTYFEPTPTSSGTEFAAVRLNANGTLDTTFGTNGEVVEPFLTTLYQTTTSSNAAATSVAIQSNGQIVLGGSAEVATPSTTGGSTQFADQFAAVRLNTDGSLDTSFGGTSAAGLVLLPFVTNPEGVDSGYATAVAIQPNGQIVLGGYGGTPGTNGSLSSGQFVVDRLNSDGTVDTTFEDEGQSIISLPTGSIINTGAMVIQATGSIVISGQLENPDEIALARFTSNGTPDSTFSNTAVSGLVTYSAFTSVSNFGTTGLAIQANGNLLFSAVEDDLSPPNPFFVASVLSPTPALDQPPADYDGSGLTNLAVYIPSIGAFAYRPTNGSPDVIEQFGIPGPGQTIPAPGDYTGAGKTEIAAYLPSYGVYAIRPADGSSDITVPFGIPGAGQSIPVPGDYFGTGVDDIAVYMPSIAAFGIRNPNGGPDEIIQMGIPGAGNSIPAPGDYFGTGQTDLAVYLPSIGAFAIRNPAGGPDEIIPFGLAGVGQSIPIPGDYDGSGKTELAVYMPSLGEFAYRPANGGPDVIIPFGSAGDGTIPVPGDYTGVGYDEIAVYDPNYADFAYHPANGSPDVIVPFGTAVPIASLPSAAPASSNITPPATTLPIPTVQATSAVPSGPVAFASSALVRVASTRPAQADPAKPTT